MMNKEKQQGQYMTPSEIVCLILNDIGYSGEEILAKKIIEPSFGNGNFLVEIIKRIIKEGLKQSLKRTTISKIISENVFGVEKDINLYKEAIDRLNDLCLDSNIPIPNWKHLYCEDMLIQYKQFINTFDYCVGNPPFVRVHNMDDKQRRMLSDFNFTNGTSDLYVVFYEIGISILKDMGKLGYISPNSFIKNTSQKPFREFLIENRFVSRLYDFKSSKLFMAADTYTCVCFLDKHNSNDYILYREYSDYNILKETTVDYEYLSGDPWILSDNKDMQFLKKNKKMPKLKDCCTIKNGIATNLDKAYILPDNNMFPDCDIIKNLCKASSYDGGELQRIIFPYWITKDCKRVPIPERVFKVEYPEVYLYLSQYKQELLKRNMDKTLPWYAYGRSQGFSAIGADKIVFKNIIDKNNPKISPTLLFCDTLVYSGFYIIPKREEDFRKIVQILKSEDFLRYCLLVGKDMANGYIQITAKMVQEYGIPKNI